MYSVVKADKTWAVVDASGNVVKWCRTRQAAEGFAWLYSRGGH